MLSLRHSPAILTKRLDFIKISIKPNNLVLCAQKGPRPRYPRVWKTKTRIGTISKSLKLLECIKGLSNVKEEVYGALDSFIAWDLEFPLITVKKALKTLEEEKEWKRTIQVTKWMLSKGQGRTMGSYFTLLNALAEDDRLEEVEELWTKIFSEHLEAVPRTFFDKMISIYYQKGMHDKMFEVFADMEELSVKPNTSIINKVGDVFQKLGMLDKYEKLHNKYPPTTWEYRYIRGKRVRLRGQRLQKFDETHKRKGSAKEPYKRLSESNKENNEHLNKVDEEEEEESSLLDEFKEPNNLLSGSNEEENNEHLNKVDEHEESSLLDELEEPNNLLSGSNEENNDHLNKVDEEENHPLNEFEEINSRLSESNEENSEHMNKADEEENNLLDELEEANQCSNEFNMEAGRDSS